ncbi:MAG: flagellar hook-associated protein FlgK [candidate division Zixibacteria bacterium]|nr:flagellar hook-associated protein FlgK [candidate division Zixibacteria bacterium]
MAGLFSGLELGKRALATHQLWLNTIGHNVANVNTPGYSRQRVSISTSTPEEHFVGMIGTGVNANDIRNVRDLFLSQQYRDENKNLGQWASQEKMLTRVEAIFMEPSTDSLGDLMEKFWTGWMDLGNNPESIAARTALKEQGNLLTTGFHRRYDQLVDLQKSIDIDVELIVNKVNSLSDEVASLNKQISRMELGNYSANDLRDRRDLMIDNLSQFIDVNTSEQTNGATLVYIGALMIVDETNALHLDTYETAGKGFVTSEVVWKGTKKTVQNYNGELKGLLEMRDKIIPQYMNDLDTLAETLVSEVNGIHTAGYDLNNSTNINFFDEHFTSAGNLRLSQEVLNNVTKIAASQSGAVGDNSNAQAVADLRKSLLMTRGTATMEEFYNTIVGQVGIDTNKAVQLRENHSLLVESLENARQSVQGVSLDEEMAQMIKYQHAFDAAARVITTVDQALEMVIMNMGIVGR